MVITCIAAALLGVFIGVLSGLLGIGGGTVMIPMFRLGFGLSAVASTATSLFTIIPTSISGLVSHIRNKTCVIKLGLAMGVGGACTSPVGVWLAQLSPGWAIMLAAAIVIGYSAISMVKKALKAPKAEQAKRDAKGGSSSPAEEIPTVQITTKQVIQGACIGLIAGVASGYIGVGGGFLMVPLMLAWLNFPMRLASGTSLLGIMILALPGAITQAVLGNIDFAIGIATAAGTIPGAFLGASLVARVPERTLRFMFAALLGVGAIMLVVNEFALV